MPVKPDSNDIPQQIEYLWRLKSAITLSNIVSVIVSLLETPLQDVELSMRKGFCRQFKEINGGRGTIYRGGSGNASMTRPPLGRWNPRETNSVQYLEGDAHILLKVVSGRLPNPKYLWETSSEILKTKYFSLQAYDRLESEFLDLRQGGKTIREYDAEFNQLKKSVGRELQD